MNKPCYSRLSYGIKIALGLMLAAHSAMTLASTDAIAVLEKPFTATQVIQKEIKKRQAGQQQTGSGQQRGNFGLGVPSFTGLQEAFIPVGSVFDPFLGFTVTDSAGNDTTAQTRILGGVDTSKPGVYQVTYLLKGAGFAGNVEHYRAVTVLESGNVPPEIDVYRDIVTYLGETFKPLSPHYATAHDFEDGNLTNKMWVIGEVDTSKVGFYPLEYRVADSQDLEAAAWIEVQVRDKRENVITLRGVFDDTVEAGAYFDPWEGVTATDETDGDITNQIEVASQVDTNLGGMQFVTYSVTNSEGVTTMRRRRIYVANTSPYIDGVDCRQIILGETFDLMDGITAADAQDGDLTARMSIDGTVDTSIPGVYTLSYTVEDNNGYITTQARNIVVRDPSVPVPHLPEIKGISDYGIHIPVGSEFDPMAKVAASDVEDGDLTPYVTVMGRVDSRLLYESQPLIYMVTDSAGYAVSRLRIVEATNQLPVIRGIFNSKIIAGDVFDPMAGVTATDREDGDVTSNVKVQGKVDTDTPGHYQLTYRVADSYSAEGYGNRMIAVVARNTAPVLRGVESVTIEQGSRFDPRRGIIAFDKEEGNISNKIRFSGQLNTRVPGIYTLTYSVTDRQGLKVTAERTVTVKEKVNAAPTLSGMAPITIDQNSYFDARRGVTASDKEDGNLTGRVKVLGQVNTRKPGIYTLTYSVTDGDGLKTTVERTVTVQEKVNTAPILSGVEPITISVGDQFNARQGVTASDQEDGNLTGKIRVYGRVNIRKTGVYTLTYSVTDRDQSTTTVQRTVTVVRP